MAQRITALRRERGLSKYRLARLAGVTEQAVGKWERRGVATAQFALMARVAQALGVPMEDLDDWKEGE